MLVVDGENKAQYREIVANSRSGNDWIVEGGLQPGEMVIVEGTGKSRPGAPVKPTVIEASQIGKADMKGDGKGDARGDGKAAPKGEAKGDAKAEAKVEAKAEAKTDAGKAAK